MYKVFYNNTFFLIFILIGAARTFERYSCIDLHELSFITLFNNRTAFIVSNFFNFQGSLSNATLKKLISLKSNKEDKVDAKEYLLTNEDGKIRNMEE